MKIAFSGKGGVGKTTLSALLCRSFSADGFKVIAIDADPDANLAYALGFPLETKVTPLVEMTDLIRERVGAEPGKAAVYFRLNPKVDDIPERFSLKIDNIQFMAMGTIRRGGSGCACPENVMVKELLSHLLLQRNEVVVLDTEAGIEHLGRGTSAAVNALLVVVESAVSSLQTFHRIKKLSADLGIGHVGAIANRVRSGDDVDRIEKEIGEKVWAAVPLDPTLSDFHGKTASGPVRDSIAVLRKKIEGLVLPAASR